MPVKKRSLKLYQRLCFSWSWGLSRCAAIIGVVVSEMTSETSTAADKVTANSRNKRPTIPAISKIGMKTATSEMLIDMTVNPMPAAPLIAASNGDMPCSRKREMFSMTTMASSTTKPVQIVSAISERSSRL